MNDRNRLYTAHARRAIALADVVINVPVEYGSLEWRRAADLIEAGYRAAEAMRDRLLPLAVSELEFEAWAAAARLGGEPSCLHPRSSNSRASPRLMRSG